MQPYPAPPQAPPPAPPPPEVDVHDPTRCMWRRSAALLVDVVIVSVVVAGVYWLSGVAYVDAAGRFVLKRGWAAVAGLWAAWIVYWSLFESLPAHATPGKLVFGVRVVRADGSPRVGAAAVLVRNVMRIPDVFLCAPAGLAVALMSVGRRRPGDMAARTLVVRRSAASPGVSIATPWTASRS